MTQGLLQRRRVIDMVDLKALTNEEKMLLIDTDKYIDFLRFCGRGNIHRFSPENQILIHRQKPSAEIVVSYDEWAREGRYPSYGTGIHLYKTETFKVKNGCVFDIKDTRGKEFNKSIEISEKDHDFLNTIFKEPKENFEETLENLTRTYVRDTITVKGLGPFTKEEMENLIIESITLIVKEKCGIHGYILDENRDRLNLLNSYAKFKPYFDATQPVIQGVSHSIIHYINKKLRRKRKEIEAYEINITRSGEQNEGRGNREIVAEDDRRRSRDLSWSRESETTNEQGRNHSTYRMDGRSSHDIHSGRISNTVFQNDDRGRDVAIRRKPSDRGEETDASSGERILSGSQREESRQYYGENSGINRSQEYSYGNNQKGSIIAQVDVEKDNRQLSPAGLYDSVISEREREIENEIEEVSGEVETVITEKVLGNVVYGQYKDVIEELEVDDKKKEDIYVEETQPMVSSDITPGNDISDGEKSYIVYDKKDDVVTLVANDGSGIIEKKESVIRDGIIMKGEAIPYHYSEEWHSNNGSDKERFNENVKAIKLLKRLEKEHRYATSDEQYVLSHYVGWGGLSNAFDSSVSQWKEEYKELKALLTEEEYQAARSSVTDSFYTPRVVMDQIYVALDRMGFKGGNVLEPSCGIGNFYNAMPEQLREQSRLYGVEIDSISGRIAKLLHPEANIQIMGFEKTELENNFFDVVIGNVPFGNYKVYDREYESNNFLIHDYFFAKALDKVAPGGLICFITSKGTLDKANSKVRKYLAERADLVGAIRLPNNTFKASANTEATSDILFLKKKDAPVICEPEWIHLGITKDGIPINSYFEDHPEMLLGTMVKDTSRFGEDRAVTIMVPREGESLEKLLKSAVSSLPENVFAARVEELIEEPEHEENTVIPADPTVKNNTFTVRNGNVYLRNNASMYLYKARNKRSLERIKGMCEIREILHKLIDIQVKGCNEEELKIWQNTLTEKYDRFVKEYGYISDSSNRNAFDDDIEYPFICSLEIPTDEGIHKSKIFTEQTIKPYIKKDKADTAIDALNMVLNDLGKVDIKEILKLYDVSFETLIEELRGEIFLNPKRAQKENPYVGWETSDEYLSGNVREKLRTAQTYVKEDSRYEINVVALEEVQPKELDASEIIVRIGTTWIDKEDYKKFLLDILEIPLRYEDILQVNYEPRSNNFNIANKSYYYGNMVNINNTYGTSRKNALEIMEDLLNLREVTVNDRIDDGDGKYHYEVNQKETMLARDKATLLKEKFSEWIFEDITRREKYVSYYNETFNSTRLREYDGSYMTFPGMNPEITMKEHQKNVVCRIVRGGNTLAAHCVGAGKSFEMAAACMELRRLGLAHKPLIVVPNHLTQQMANEFLTLYPSANLLLTTKKDFEKKKRRRFISKIATGDYDAVIIGHSQFEKIPLSTERQTRYLNEEIREVMDAIAEIKDNNNERWTIKQMEAQRKSLEARLESLKREGYKDDIITFEELGVDAIFLDEAHEYKNLSFTTKMTRVAGINPNGAKKSLDMFLKIRYIQEMTPGKNIVFATGTPISNTMGEMYIMQKYLQMDRLKELGIYHFDSWAANFGETVTSMELTPDGGGYREKTRFAKFVNLPELLTLFHEFADVQLLEMLNLKVPKYKCYTKHVRKRSFKNA